MTWNLLVPLLALLPLVCSLSKRSVMYVGVGVTWVTLAVSFVFGSSGSSPLVALGQIPLFILTTSFAVLFSNQGPTYRDDLLVQAEEIKLAQARRRQAQLKADVAAIEREESLALQIYGAAKSLAEALSWKEMAPRLTSAIQKIFGTFEFLLYAIDDAGHWNLLHRRGGWAQEPPIHGSLPESVKFFHPPTCSEVVPVLTIPIPTMTSEGLQIRGAMFMKSPIGERTEEELMKIGQGFGSQLGMSLSKALLFSQMEEHSRVDGLTGVLRRQAFMDRLAEEFKRARVFHTPFSVMMVDIDHFKAINDAHGHATGDAVLKRIGEILKSAVYETDVVGRYGGEEFIILMPKAQVEGVRRKSEALRQRIEHDVITSGFERLHVTVSIGLSHHPQNGQTAEILIREADRALYRAKETGRNRIVEA